MNILICDEARADTDKLTDILDRSYDPAMKKVVFHRASDALSYVRSGGSMEICFLETDMREMSGIELAKEMRANGYVGEIIFLSSTNGYAAEAYKVKAFSYLLKPATSYQVLDVLSGLENKFMHRNRRYTGARHEFPVRRQ